MRRGPGRSRALAMLPSDERGYFFAAFARLSRAGKPRM
jgi:hypothetical protein